MFSLRWQWDNPEMWSKLGILFSAAVCLMVAYLAFFRRKRLSPYSLTLLAAILAVGVPLFLPHMHERYFYLADVLILPLAVAKPKLAPAVALSGFASILGYYAYLRQQWLLTMNFGFYALAAALVILVAAFILEPRGSEKLRKP
jgi:predicted RND superfamily exporter protein